MANIVCRYSKSNIAFHYMYRDEDNYKNIGTVVFSNPRKMTPVCVEKAIRNSLEEGCYFIAHQVDIPEVFLWSPYAMYDPNDPSSYPSDMKPGNYVINTSDHCWHELCQIYSTYEHPTDKRAIHGFIKDIEKASQDWQEFAPTERRQRR